MRGEPGASLSSREVTFVRREKGNFGGIFAWPVRVEEHHKVTIQDNGSGEHTYQSNLLRLNNMIKATHLIIRATHTVEQINNSTLRHITRLMQLIEFSSPDFFCNKAVQQMPTQAVP